MFLPFHAELCYLMFMQLRETHKLTTSSVSVTPLLAISLNLCHTMYMVEQPTSSLFTLTMSTFSNLMHGAFFQSIFTQCDNYVSSTAITSVHLDVITGTVAVLYNNDLMYRYTNVSRRAILKFILDDARSLGRFVNTYCKADGVKCVELANLTPNYVLG